MYGHWCCMVRDFDDDDKISFFDSYGDFPDDQLLHIPEQYRIEYNMTRGWIARLLHDSDLQIEYSPYRYQDSLKSETCGRWAGIFMRLRADPEDVRNFLKSLKTTYEGNLHRKINWDVFIVLVTEKYLK